MSKEIPASDWMILLILIVVLVLGAAMCMAAPTESEIRKAMKTYKQSHPLCESCFKPATFLRGLEVCHIKPRHAFPDLAADTNNFLMLHRNEHIVYQHAGDGACRKYVENLREVLALRVIKENEP